MRESPGWIQTVRRVLPELVKLSRQINPTFELKSVVEIDDRLLERHAVSGLIWDVDGTLMAHHASEVDPKVRGRFEALLARSDLRHAIVSNCRLPRFRQLGTMFPEVPVLLAFETAAGKAFRILRGERETLAGPGKEELIAEAGAEPIRKPSAALILEAIRQMGMEDRPDRVLVVGDQYLTDIASANLAGVRSAKVRTIDPASFPTAVRIGQWFERMLKRVCRGGSGRRPRIGHVGRASASSGHGTRP